MLFEVVKAGQKLYKEIAVALRREIGTGAHVISAPGAGCGAEAPLGVF
jgi:hypothetical protein